MLKVFEETQLEIFVSIWFVFSVFIQEKQMSPKQMTQGQILTGHRSL